MTAIPGITGSAEATVQWCAERGHPWSTYSPWLHRTWCRCGQRQADGEQPVDLDAIWEMFHDHPRGAACSCYARAEQASRRAAAGRS